MFQLITIRGPIKGKCNRCKVVFIKGAPRSASKLGTELIQLIDTPHIFENVQGLIEELNQLIERCLVIGTGE